MPKSKVINGRFLVTSLSQASLLQARHVACALHNARAMKSFAALQAAFQNKDRACWGSSRYNLAGTELGS